MDELDELNYRVAQAVGWRWYRLHKTCPHCGGTEYGSPIFTAYAPAGMVWHECDAPEAVKASQLHGVPKYTRDISAAFSLLVDLPAGYGFSISRAGVSIWCEELDDYAHADITHPTDYPAAICRAWAWIRVSR